MDETEEPTNVFQIGAKRPTAKVVENNEMDEIANTEFPDDDYTIVDIDGNEWYASGFLIFTPHHISIMKKTALGAVPGLVLPIGRVKAAYVEEEVLD